MDGIPASDADPPRPRVEPPATAATAPAAGEPAEARYGVGNRELAGWILVVLAITAVRAAALGGPQLFNDSYQYLSVAEHLGEDGSISTSIVHFDTERARGRIPAPVTTFPPGYPVLVWALSWTGLAPEWRGLLLSLLATVAVTALLRSGARALHLTPAATRLSLLVWVASAQGSFRAVTVSTEAAFTATALGALVLLLQHERDPSARGSRVALACALAGVSYWIRYAGLFLVAAIHVVALGHAVRAPGRRRLWLWSVAGCDAVVGLLMIRNEWIAGTWQGGNTRVVPHTAASVLYRLAGASAELLLGPADEPIPLAIVVFALVTVAGAAAACVAVVRAVARRRLDVPARPAQLALLIGYGAIHSGAVSWLGFRTHISLDARMFVPLLPVAAMLVGITMSSFRERPLLSRGVAPAAFAAVFAIGYAGANLASMVRTRPAPGHAAVADALALPTASGEPLRRWIERAVPADAVLLAVDGQATGFVLRRRTISVVGRVFTDMTWSEEQTREVMRTFGSDYVVVYPRVVASGAIDQLDSELFRRLAAGAPPPWLALAAENPAALVYRARF